MTEDCELMARVSGGDTEAFDALVQRHRQRLQSFLYRLCSDTEEAADCAQEALLRLWLKRETYRPEAKFTTYLYTIAHNCFRDRLRRQRVRPQTTPLEQQVGPAARTLLQRLSRPADTPEHALFQRLRMAQVRAAVQQLPENQRIVFVLGHFEELPYEQIGRILDVPVGTVKSRMHYAVARLRETLLDATD